MRWSVQNICSASLLMLFVLSVKSEQAKDEFFPSNYKITINTAEEHFKDSTKELSYNGEVEIDFERKGGAPNKDFEIILHRNPDAKKKETVKLTGVTSGTPDTDVDINVETNGDKLIIKCKAEHSELKNFKLTVKFEYPFGKDMTGFYRSSYKNSNGDTKWLLTTHFEPIFARKAFPCFDKPNLKAKFQIIITVPKSLEKELTALSNTAMTKSAEEKSIVYTSEGTDIVMSTYLVAFTVSDFKPTNEEKFESEYKKKSQTNQETDRSLKTKKTEKSLKTYGRADIIAKNEGDLAQKIGKGAVQELTKYLGEGYAFKKIDQVGIPDFSAGAMENFGHISFREKSLFFNEANGAAATKQAIVLTVTHELVHQWFGNLVTLESWDYIWLNEAFATYIEYIIANKLDTSSTWNLLNQMVVNEIHLRALETDALVSSKPLNNIIANENLIFSSFNDIPYSKGASVLRMWDLQIPDGGFQKSLKKYIQDRKEDTANPDQLFEAFKISKTLADGKETSYLTEKNFKSWTQNAGYPVVEVKKKNGTYTLTQTRFFWEDKKDNDTVWEIPITFNSDKSQKYDTIPTLWLSKTPLEVKHECKWIIFNNQQAGYYRVNYDKENWKALTDALQEAEHSKIPELNRAQIINDVFSLARSLQKDYVDYSTALKLANYLTKEKSFVPWKTALNSLEFLHPKLIMNKEDNKKFKDYIISLIKPHFKTLTSTGKDHVEKLMNVEISRWACSLDYEPCVKEAKDIFGKNEFNKHPDTQEIILCTAVRTEKSAWDKVSEQYKKEQDSALKVMYISALGCSGNKDQIEGFLNESLKVDSFIRKQDLMFVLSSVYNGNLGNIEIAFKFIENNYEKIAEIYGGINPLGRALVGIAKKLNSKEQLDRLEKLVDKVKKNDKLSAAKESAENALNIARSNKNWVEKRMDQVKKYLNSGSYLTYSLALLSLSLLTVFQF